MKISIVIFTRNRKHILETALNQYKKQTYQNFEIILLDNGSTDGTKEMIRSNFPEIQYIYFPDNLFLYAFNYGVTIATGDLIWRTDDDAYPKEITLFENIVNKFQTFPEIDIIATEIFENELQYNVNWYSSLINHPLNENMNTETGYNVNMFLGAGAMIRKTDFDEIGGFWDFGYEELDFATRAIIKNKILRVFPQFVVIHCGNKSQRDWGERRLKYYTMLTRYFTIYFPFINALTNTFFILLIFNLYVIIQRYKFSIFIEGNLSIVSQFIRSMRLEKRVVSKAELYKITFGYSYIKREISYFLNKISLKFKNN